MLFPTDATVLGLRRRTSLARSSATAWGSARRRRREFRSAAAARATSGRCAASVGDGLDAWSRVASSTARWCRRPRSASTGPRRRRPAGTCSAAVRRRRRPAGSPPCLVRIARRGRCPRRGATGLDRAVRPGDRRTRCRRGPPPGKDSTAWGWNGEAGYRRSAGRGVPWCLRAVACHRCAGVRVRGR